MNLNTMAYSEVDTIETPRSHWTTYHTHKTTFNAGKLVPIYFNEDIIPGTTIKMKMSMVIRMSTPLNPTMDNLKADVFWFRGQKKWYWDHFVNQMGQNDNGAWDNNQIEYTTPVIKVSSARPVQADDLLAYMGVPLGAVNCEIDKLGVNFYQDIWNYNFRSQAVHAPKIIDKSDADLTTDGTIATGCGLLPVCRNFDYFSSALPEPQRGQAITSPLGTTAPVIGNGKAINLHGVNNSNLDHTLTFGGPDGALIQRITLGLEPKQIGVFPNTGQTINGREINDVTTAIGLSTQATNSGMIADLTQATAATINALRLAFATQRILEKDALYGTTYRDLLRGQFGVSASSEALMIPELLGARSVPINIETVLQQSATDTTSPLGNTGAFSVTADIDTDFIKSFSTHDMIFGLICVRVDNHTYAQGLPRQFTRQRRLDHYWPSLAHIGNQPIYNYEIYARGTAQDNQVFGYKEAWQEYLYKQNRVSGQFHPDYAQSLDVWTYVDDYSSLPTLSPAWMEESIYNIDRTLAVQSSESDQFIADFYFEEDISAPIPLHRTPGLIDHY